MKLSKCLTYLFMVTCALILMRGHILKITRLFYTLYRADSVSGFMSNPETKNAIGQ